MLEAKFYFKTRWGTWSFRKLTKLLKITFLCKIDSYWFKSGSLVHYLSVLAYSVCLISTQKNYIQKCKKSVSIHLQSCDSQKSISYSLIFSAKPSFEYNLHLENLHFATLYYLLGYLIYKFMKEFPIY